MKFVAVAILIFSLSSRAFGLGSVIGFDALKDALDEDAVVLIDVRNRTELNENGQIPKSFCVPLHEIRDEAVFQTLDEDQFFARYGLVKPAKDDAFVLTCRSGRRAKFAASLLRQLGYRRIKIYAGSFLDWVARNGPIVSGNFDLDYH